MTAPPDFLFWYKAKVVHVVDGDTLDLDTDLGFRIAFRQRYRLYGVDTPELNDPDPAVRERAVKAKEFVQARVGGREVVLHTPHGPEGQVRSAAGGGALFGGLGESPSMRQDGAWASYLTARDPSTLEEASQMGLKRYRRGQRNRAQFHGGELRLFGLQDTGSPKSEVGDFVTYFELGPPP